MLIPTFISTKINKLVLIFNHFTSIGELDSSFNSEDYACTAIQVYGIKNIIQWANNRNNSLELIPHPYFDRELNSFSLLVIGLQCLEINELFVT